jgi:hypothetical protein
MIMLAYRMAIQDSMRYFLLFGAEARLPSEATVEAAARPATTPEGFMADLAVAKLFETRTSPHGGG